MISTHILDTHLGKPAPNVTVRLIYQNQLMSEGFTNQDGRISFNVQTLQAGHYKLIYDIAPYFSQHQLSTFFPEVCIQFYLDYLQEHYHIPLLISPYAYSTYRGS